MADIPQNIPHNIDAEKAVLGAALVDAELPVELLTNLKADDFYIQKHQEIYKAINILVDQDKPVSIVTVPEISKKVKASDVAQIAEQHILRPEFKSYCDIVKEASKRRKLIMFSVEARQKAQQNENINEILNELEQKWLNLNTAEASDWETNRELIIRHMENIENRMNKEGLTGVRSGFIDLDEMTSGWQPGQLIFAGAVPKMGKTSLGLHFALNANIPSLFFTLEMLPEEIADRQISSEANIEGRKIKSGRINDDDMQEIIQGGNRLVKKPLGWVSKSGITVSEIRAICRKYKAEHGLGLVVIDQLDKIEEKRLPGENTTDVIGKITKGLKNIARDLEVPVIVLLQLNDKEVSKRGIPRPQHGDIRNSSCPDQDGDVVLFLWRPEFYWPDNERYENRAEIIISRQRSGKTGSIWVTWQPDYTRFASLAKEYWLSDGDFK